MKADNKIVSPVAGKGAARLSKNQELRLCADLPEMATEAMLVRNLHDGVIQYWNTGAEQLYGWCRDEARGRDIHELLQTVDAASRQEAERELISHGSWQGRLVQRTREGREVVVDSRRTFIRKLGAVLEVNHDVTLAVKAEEALQESEKLASMGRVAGMVVHEINNPLAAIANLFYLLQAHPSLDDEARTYATAAEKELERVMQITRRTLSFYRETRQPTTLYITDLLDEVLELQKGALRSAGIRVAREYSATSTVLEYPSELRQVFLNLIVNAMQAMPHGGTLRLCVRESVDTGTGQRGQSVSIIDTGTGIRVEDRKHLFEPFFSTKAAKGTGLGLWISKGILEKYGGHISYRCYQSGGSNLTCFRVFLPCEPARKASGAEAHVEQPQAVLQPSSLADQSIRCIAH